MHPCVIQYQGVLFLSLETAYQAAKSGQWDLFVNLNGYQAKRLGRKLPVREDWNDMRLEVMRELLAIKFAPGTVLAAKLLATGYQKLVEGNTWNDKFWGVCLRTGEGENHLGRLLMEQRRNLMPVVTLGVTGHRPQKLGGFGTEVHVKLRKLARKVISHYGPGMVITGMALGWDMAVAQACVDLGVPFTAAIPFKGQESKWLNESQVLYQELLKHAAAIVVVSPGGYSADAMYRRNEWIVDHSTILAALWDGQPNGGTYNCLQYAKTRNIQVVNCWKAYHT